MATRELGDYMVTVASGATKEIPIASARSFQILEVTGLDASKRYIQLKLYNAGEKAANPVTVKEGWGTFIGQSFATVEIRNTNSVSVYIHFITSPDLINDASVYGSVAITNGTVPNPDPTATPVYVPIYTQDFKTQNTSVYPTFSSVNGFSVLNDFSPVYFTYKGSVTTDATYKLTNPFLTFSVDSFVKSLIIEAPFALGTSSGTNPPYYVSPTIMGISMGSTKAAAIPIIPYQTPAFLFGSMPDAIYKKQFNFNCYIPAGTNVYGLMTIATTFTLSTSFPDSPFVKITVER